MVKRGTVICRATGIRGVSCNLQRQKDPNSNYCSWLDQVRTDVELSGPKTRRSMLTHLQQSSVLQGCLRKDECIEVVRNSLERR